VRDLFKGIGVTYAFSWLECLELSRRDGCNETLCVVIDDDFWSGSVDVRPSCVRLARTHNGSMKVPRLHFLDILTLIRSNFIDRACDSLLPETHCASSSLTAEVERLLLDGQ
jgi:hypothetical protein